MSLWGVLGSRRRINSMIGIPHHATDSQGGAPQYSHRIGGSVYGM